MGYGPSPGDRRRHDVQLIDVRSKGEWDSGRIDVTGDVTSITLTAPAGMVITATCVKAGSANQGLGAEITYYDPGVTSVTLTHTSGKGLSHYSVMYGTGGPSS